MSRLLRLAWLVVVALWALPTVLLVAAGSWWLFERRLFWYWIGLTGATVLLGWWLSAWLRRRGLDAWAGAVEPDTAWAPRDEAAWEKVEALARRSQDEDLPLDRTGPATDLFREVLETVARHYHPESQRPELEIPAPYVLRIVEQVAADLRAAFSEHVPGAHIFTLHDLYRLRRVAALYRHAYLVYRVIHFGYNPVAALLREVRDAASGQMVGSSAGELKRFAVGFCVRKAGYYAIQLYGGKLTLEGVPLAGGPTRRSRRDAALAEKRAALDQEPLRILILGQVKSGKSSLVNALFGEVRAAVDVVPRTKGVEPYVLERDGLPRAILLDTAGYETAGAAADAFGPLRREVLGCDLAILVASAVSAARQPDRLLLDRLRELFQANPDRVMPPLVVVVTHVDRLRPLAEWNPPYDVVHPAGEKGRQIREALDAVRQDLALGDDHAVVPVCLQAGRLYNVEEGLAPAILEAAPEAQRAKYVRCLRQSHDEDYWRRLWQQAVGAGRVLVRAGREWVRRK